MDHLKKKKIVKEIKSITLIVLGVLIFRSVFFEPFRIPSGSMIPTLMIGDFVLVNKMSYGFKIPFSDFFSDPVYLGKAKEPKRGDVIVFKYPKDTSINYIKRVIGIPGDTIEIREKKIYINDQPVAMTPVDGSKIMDDMDDKFKKFDFRFYETKTGEHGHLAQYENGNQFFYYYEKRVIPEGEYFVMGDNRDYSADSRVWGLVPHRFIKGEALLVWFSLIFPFGENEFKFRPWRIGTMIR